MAASPTSASATAGDIPSAGSAPATGAVLPTVTNFQGTAGQNIGNAKATALAQIAAAGSKGQAAIQQAQQQNAAAKTQAIQSILQNNALHGAPIGNTQANEQTGTIPLANSLTNLQDMGANYEANNQGLQAANANYFAGLQGALPIDAAAVQTDISNDQSKNASAATAANLKLATEQLAYQTALAKQGAGQTPAQVLSQLGGAQLAGQQFNQDATQLQTPTPGSDNTGVSALGPGGVPDLGGGVSGVAVPGQTQSTPGLSPADSYGKIDAALGLPPGYSQSVASNSEQASREKAIADSSTQQKDAAAGQKAANPTNYIGTANALATGAYPTSNGGKGTPQSQQSIAAYLESQGATPAQAQSIAKNAWTAANPQT